MPVSYGKEMHHLSYFLSKSAIFFSPHLSIASMMGSSDLPNIYSLILPNFKFITTFVILFKLTTRLIDAILPLDSFMLKSIEICAGAGGQALGLELAGFTHTALVEYEADYCNCLRHNRPNWNVICADVRNFDGRPFKDSIDLLAGGVPCPPFSVAGKQLGNEDERDLFPEMLRLVEEINPRAVMIENVRGLLAPKFDEYRNTILQRLSSLNYSVHIKLINASDYGVPQLRPRVIIVGIRKDITDTFHFPEATPQSTPSVGECLYDLMAANGWRGVDSWKNMANKIAPTIVGGSKKHGGPDLGPTRARNAWAELNVDGKGVANDAPAENFSGMPRLTPRMIARIQGFPDDWDFGKRKTLACRMIGNAFPPPVAKEVGLQIATVLNHEKRSENERTYISRAQAIPSLFN